METSRSSLIKMLRERRELVRDKQEKNETKLQVEQKEILQELRELQDERTRIKENINKNLKNLSTQKHGIQRIAQGSYEDTPMLPVTHKHQEQVIGFVSDSIEFINSFEAMGKQLEVENDIDTANLCNEISDSAESVNKELMRAKISIDQVEIISEDSEMIAEQYFLLCDEDQGLNGSIL